MNQTSLVNEVLRGFAVSVQQIRSLGTAGGFSGANFWQIETATDTLCLRRWHSRHPSQARLRMIHNVLRHVRTTGLEYVPTLYPTVSGESFVVIDGALWELTDWMPGKADFLDNSSAKRRKNIMTALAQFHLAAASTPQQESAPGCSSAISDRLTMLRRVRQDEVLSKRLTISGIGETELEQEVRTLAQIWSQLFHESSSLIERDLTQATTLVLPIQPCIRDVRHDHVLLSGDQVTGIVDYGAMRADSTAGDLSRLLGDLFGNDRASWNQAIDEYQTVRSLTKEELAILDVFDRSSVLLTPVNWFRWILVEGRKFEHSAVVLERIRGQLNRLRNL